MSTHQACQECGKVAAEVAAYGGICVMCFARNPQAGMQALQRKQMEQQRLHYPGCSVAGCSGVSTSPTMQGKCGQCYVKEAQPQQSQGAQQIQTNPGAFVKCLDCGVELKAEQTAATQGRCSSCHLANNLNTMCGVAQNRRERVMAADDPVKALQWPTQFQDKATTQLMNNLIMIINRQTRDIKALQDQVKALEEKR